MGLYREVAGDGEPVVLLHAGLGDSRMWEGQWNAFSARYRTVRCDLRGWGRSPIGPGSFSNAADVLALCGELAIERAALVGISMGGQVALELAVARPELVSALVLAGASLPGHEWSDPVRAVQDEEEAALARGDVDAAIDANLRLWLAGLRRGIDDVDPAVRELVVEMLRQAIANWLPVADSVEEELLVPDLTARLGEIACPALVLAGEEDVTDIHVIAQRLREAIPGARAATIPAAAHLPQLERPADFNELVLAFLAVTLVS
jgi:pimeloyl-ACP methyl ester carboxylesterase